MSLVINCVQVNTPQYFCFEPAMNHQLSRRYFLQATTAIALSQMLLGCSNAENILQVLFLENSIPPQLIRDFRKGINQTIKVDFKPQTQLPQIFDSLLNLQQSKRSDQKTKNIISKIFNKSEVYPNLTSLGDVWLATAIQQNLIKPLSVNSLKNWQELPTFWQKSVRRDRQGNLSPNGEIYGAPYRWGSTVIAYRSDKLAKLDLIPTDWQDLWLPQLQDRISLLESPREVIGLTLKKLGKSYNTKDLDADPQFKAKLQSELLALHQQTKLYSSDRYLEPLILGDTWAAVAWSTDILPIQKRYPEIKFIIPASGTSLWADLWVEPQSFPTSVTGDKEFNNQDQQTRIAEWIDYCWQPQAAKQISLFTNGISPVLSALASAEIPPDLKNNVFLNSTILNADKGEFLLPLSPKTEQHYRKLWLDIRST